MPRLRHRGLLGEGDDASTGAGGGVGLSRPSSRSLGLTRGRRDLGGTDAHPHAPGRDLHLVRLPEPGLRGRAAGRRHHAASRWRCCSPTRCSWSPRSGARSATGPSTSRSARRPGSGSSWPGSRWSASSSPASSPTAAPARRREDGHAVAQGAAQGQGHQEGAGALRRRRRDGRDRGPAAQARHHVSSSDLQRRAQPALGAAERRRRRARRAALDTVDGGRPRRVRRQRRRPGPPGGRHADPGRLQVGAGAGAAEPGARPRRLPRRARLHAAPRPCGSRSRASATTSWSPTRPSTAVRSPGWSPRRPRPGTSR